MIKLFAILYTLLQTLVFSESDTNISQGSVATHVRCGEVINDHFIARLLLTML